MSEFVIWLQVRWVLLPVCSWIRCLTPGMVSFSARDVMVEKVEFHRVALAEQYAEILTNPLGRDAFCRHREFCYETFMRVFVCWV